MAKRTGLQALEDDLKAAEAVISRAKEHRKVREDSLAEAKEQLRGAVAGVTAAEASRDRILAAIDALVDKSQQENATSDGAATSAPG